MGKKVSARRAVEPAVELGGVERASSHFAEGVPKEMMMAILTCSQRGAGVKRGPSRLKLKRVRD